MTTPESSIITIDIDWAPDFIIDQVAEILIENKTKATWFVTHHSDAIERLRKNSELFELGLHPNMLPGSSHGSTEDEVLSHVKEIVPEATSMRTHGLYQTSNWLIKAAKEYGIKTDVSLFVPRATHLKTHNIRWGNSFLLRIPYFWEDDSEMFEKKPIWKTTDQILNTPGLKIFDFHPFHIVLNTSNYNHYENLKKTCPINSWDENFIKEHINEGDGPGTLFVELAKQLTGAGTKINEIAADFVD
ncbi:MAG: polysaccharide deacetylase WbmS family protein [Planctomycetota bacterium]|jgi:hypothetical protein